MKKIVGVIPARYGSVRFPGKPLALLGGKPMLLWVLEAARKSKTLSEVFVATDDERIAQMIRENQGEVVMTEPKLASGTDRICAALKGRAADLVVNIQGDEPLLVPEMIDQLVAPLFTEPELEMSTLAHTLLPEDLGNPNVVKVVCNQQGHALYFSRFAIPYSRQSAEEPLASLRHIGLYAYQRHFLEKFCITAPSPLEVAESLEQLRALELGARIRVVKTEYQSQGVDTPLDLARIEKCLSDAK